jgi:hypothetical protein
MQRRILEATLFNQFFEKAQEKSIAEHIILVSELFSGFTKEILRKATYMYAERQSGSWRTTGAEKPNYLAKSG